MKYEFFIARRYLESKRRTGFISVNTGFSIGGVMLGVAALIITLSGMNGFRSEVRDRIIGTAAHLQVRKFHNEGIAGYQELVDQLARAGQVVGVSPFILSETVVAAKNNTSGVMVKGIDTATISQISDLAGTITDGHLALGEVPDPAAGDKRYPGIVLGRDLVRRLHLGRGDRVIMVSPQGLASPGGWSLPKLSSFIVTGIFDAGYYEYNDNLAYISLAAAQRVFGLPGQVTHIGLNTDDTFGVVEIARRIGAQLGYPFYALSWIEQSRSLFSWMTIQKWAMSIVLSLIIVVAAFNIISTLIMVVMEKTGDIGILKSLGARERSIRLVFMAQGLAAGVIGTALGCLVGYGLCWLQLKFKWISLPAEVYFINALPIRVEPADFVLIVGAALLLCLLAGWYPAWKASRMEPLDVIRYQE